MQIHCNGNVPVIDNIWLTPRASTARRRCSGRAARVRIVTNDFMFTGGDGYTAFTGGTDVLRTGDLLLDVAIEYIKTHSPVAPAIEGRRIGP